MSSKSLLELDTDKFKSYHVSCLIGNYVISYLNNRYYKKLELHTHLQIYVFYIFVKVLQKHDIYLFDDEIRRGRLNPSIRQVYNYFHIQNGPLRQTGLMYTDEKFNTKFVDIDLSNTVLVNTLQEKGLLETVNSVIDRLHSLDHSGLINLYTSNPSYDIGKQHHLYTEDQLYNYMLEF